MACSHIRQNWFFEVQDITTADHRVSNQPGVIFHNRRWPECDRSRTRAADNLWHLAWPCQISTQKRDLTFPVGLLEQRQSSMVPLWLHLALVIHDRHKTRPSMFVSRYHLPTTTQLGRASGIDNPACCRQHINPTTAGPEGANAATSGAPRLRLRTVGLVARH